MTCLHLDWRGVSTALIAAGLVWLVGCNESAPPATSRSTSTEKRTEVAERSSGRTEDSSGPTEEAPSSELAPAKETEDAPADGTSATSPATDDAPAPQNAVALANQAPPSSRKAKSGLSVPPEAFFCLQIGDLQAAWQKWQKTTYHDWSHSPAMKPFKDELLAKNVPSMMNPQAFLGFEDEKLALFREPAVYFVVPAANEEVETGFVIQTTDEGSIGDCLTSAAKHFVGRKWAGKETKVPGTTRCLVYSGPKDKDGNIPQRVYFTTATSFGIASHLDVVTKYASGQKSSLTDSAEYQTTIADAEKFASEAAADANWFLRPMAWVYHVKPKPADPPPTFDKSGKPKAVRKRDDFSVVSKRQGFDALKAMAGVVTIDGLNSEPEQAFSVLAPAPYTKGMMLLEWLPGKQPEIPAWLPANLASLSIVHVDPDRGFTGYGHWFDEFNRSPGLFADILNSMMRDPNGPKVDLRKDLVQNLNPTVVLLVDYAGKPTKENPQGKRSVNYHTTDKGQAVLESLNKFYKGDPNVKRDQINGWTMWTAKPGMSLMLEGSDDRLPKVECMAIKENDLLMSSAGNWVQEIIQGGAAAGGLPADATFKSAATQWTAWETDRTSMRSLSNSQLSLARSYEGLRSGDAALDKTQETKMLRTMLAGDPEGTRGINYKLLPTFDQTRKFMLPSVTSVQTTKTGFQARMGYLKQ